ncbi:MAG: MqnA/MqnD/SBP family protein [Vulcanimicrobiota bacterium]
MRIRIGHTPDADDAFMFYGINQGRVNTQGLEITHELQPMQQLNRWSLEGRLEMTACSFATLAQCFQHYRPIQCGISLGHGTGPMVISRPETSEAEIRAGLLASPGDLTSAHWLTQLWSPGQPTVPVRFDQTLEAVLSGQAAAAVVIHEGQMSYQEAGLKLVVDLGAWWFEQTGLPIPLGVNGVRRDLPGPVQTQLAQALHDSIALALQEVEPALDQALPLARGLDRERCREFVLRYVNQSTLDPGADGRRAVSEFYRRAHLAGLTPKRLEPDWIVPSTCEQTRRTE